MIEARQNNGNFLLQVPVNIRPDDIKHFSYSSLDNFYPCQLKGVFYIQKSIIQGESEEAVLGKAFHRLAEKVGNGMAPAQAMSEVISEFTLTPDQVGVLENWWWGWYNEEKFRDIVHTEYKFSIDLGRKVIGYIDAVKKVGENTILIDYKTGDYYSYTKAKGHFQLALYALAWLKTHPDEEKVVTVYDFINGGTITKTFSRDDMDRIERSVTSLINKIENSLNAGMVEAVPGEACVYCPAKEYCDAYRHYIERSPESPLLNLSTPDLEKELWETRTKIRLLQSRMEKITEILLQRREELQLYSVEESVRYGDLLIPFPELVKKLSPGAVEVLLSNVKIPSSVLRELPEKDRQIITAFLEEKRVFSLRGSKNSWGDKDD
ncbi:MAG: RecB family exonuclease [Thermoplasmata archaeon]